MKFMGVVGEISTALSRTYGRYGQLRPSSEWQESQYGFVPFHVMGSEKGSLRKFEEVQRGRGQSP